MSKDTYDESSIKILHGLEAVRKRPGMYIGSTDKRGMHHLVWELVDNAIDEVINGYGNYIKILMHKDGSITVADNLKSQDIKFLVVYMALVHQLLMLYQSG